jgi:hypothetical protein
MRNERLTMAKLIYSAISSLDGYIADEEGNFDWAAPDEEVHTFSNDLERQTSSAVSGTVKASNTAASKMEYKGPNAEK